MKKSILSGIACLLAVGLVQPSVSAETVLNVPLWAKACDQYDDIDPTSQVNPSFQHMNCLVTNAALVGNIPPEILKGIVTQESQWRQFSGGKPLVSKDYGAGLMQITNKLTDSAYQNKIQHDIYFNIEEGVRILLEKTKRPIPFIIGANWRTIENWYFPVMSYNGEKPMNSPLVQETGEKNEGAYQEEVFDTIRWDSYRKDTDFGVFPFAVDQFEYNPEKTDNIVFLQKQYLVPDVHETSYLFKKGDIVFVTEDGVKIRKSPGGDSKGSVAEFTSLVIDGPFEYNEDENEAIQFVWYPVHTRDGGTSGYISSGYIEKQLDLKPPVISGVKQGLLTNKSVKITFNEGNALLNGQDFPSGGVVSAHGRYKLIVSDLYGNTSTVSFEIDKKAPSKPSGVILSDKSTTLSGKSEANSVVSITLPNKNVITTTAKSNGVFSIAIPRQKAGTTITMTATDKAGNKSQTLSVIVQDKTAPKLFSLATITKTTTKVTGKTEAGATIRILRGGAVIGKGTATKTGTFSVGIPRQKAKTNLTITISDKAGNTMKKPVTVR